ncbi:MAG: hypothetical protein LBM08_00055, partial [Dysgonamonadaceae bacterium]|nr:hypothetical protein [Dysgonamonadaceae bacterium]
MKTINNLLICLFLLCASGMHAQTINWGTGINASFASDINVGSSVNSFVEFYFYATGSDINNGIVEIVLPYAEEVFDETQVTKLGAVDLGIPSIISDRTLRFPATNIAIGQVVYYRIPRYSKTQYNGIRTGNQNVTVNVYENNSTSADNRIATLPLTYTYNYAKVEIRDPASLPADQNPNLAMSFGSNNAVDKELSYIPQTFQFELFAYGGAVDSLTITLSFPVGGITLSNWKTGNPGSQTSISLDQIITTNTTTAPYITNCTVKLRKSDFPSGKGIGYEESVPVFVDVAKNNCGNMLVMYASAWAVQNNIKIQTDISNIQGTFSANIGNHPYPEIVSVPDNMKIDEIICQDGSVNEFSCAITNKGQGQARNIMLYCGMRNFGFVDTSTIKIKKGNNGEWEKPQRINIINKYSTGSSINPLYRGIAQSVLIEAPQYLAENNQDTLYICFGGGIPSDFYRYIWKINGSVHRTPFYETQLFSYTNACGETMRANANQYYYLDPSDCYNGFYNFSTANALSFLTNNAVETYTTEMDIAALNSSLLSSDNAKAVCQITLPKGLILETQTDADITVYRKGYPATVWPVKDFTYSLNAAGDSTVYRFTLYKTDKPEALTYGMLSLNLKSTCENDKNETVNGEIRLFIYPTGTVGGGCADVMYDGMQIYPSFTLMCKKEGVTYDYTFRRMTMGWTDDNNDGEPDYGNTPADPEKIQHTFLLMSDTAQFSWEANMLEDGDTTLYAVLFTGLDNDKLAVNPVAKVLTLNENAGLLQDSLVNSRSGNITVPRDGSFVQPNAGYAYIWEISKKDGKPFSMNDKVVFTVEIQCPNNYNTNSTMSTMNSWFYASKTSRIKGASLQARLDSVLIIGDERKGKEAYPFSFNYSAPPIVITDNTGYTNNPSYQFNGITENPITHGVDVGTTRLNQTLAPYEYRHVGTVDSIIIELPEGYVFTENSATCRIAYYLQTGGSSSKDTVLTASDVHVNSFTRKTFVLGSNVFDVNWNGSTKFPLPDGRYFVSIRNLKVSSVPGAPTGTSYATMTVYCDNHTYTQANIPRMAKENALVDYANHSNEAFAFTYIDAGSLRAVSAGNTVQNALSSTVSWMLSLQNTRTSGNACGGWLYVQGPVQNTRLIRQGGAVYTGIGDGGRWIPLPNISPGAPLTDTLVVEYSGTDCNNQTVTVYPIFDPTQTGTGWNPYINGSIEMTDAGFLVAQQTDMSGPKQYIYPKLTLTVQNVESRLSGYIKPLSATPVNPVVPEAGDYTDNEIFINKNFPVEIAFSTFGAQGAVVNTTAQLRVPAGLQYVPDSTYIEINDVNYKVTGSTFIAELQKLDGSADKIITLQLSDAGIAALGSNGQIPGNDTTYLRLKLKPTCDIGFSTPRIGVIFNGERICGASIVTNNREYYSSWLTLGGKSSALNMVMENPTVSVSDFMCNTTAEAVLKFKNQTGPNVSVVISDSLRLVVPKAIDLESGATPVTYNLPAATDYPSGLQGTVSVEAISNRVIGDFRYLTWPMPKTYFDNLASRSEGVQSQNNEYTIQLCFSQPEDYFNGNAHAAVVTAAGLDGCPSISSEFFEKEVPVIT